MNRIQLDIQGSTYTLPIHPVTYDHLMSIEYEAKRTLDGKRVRFAPNFDQRRRKMRWEDLPNSNTFNTMVATLRSAVGISGVRLNQRGISIFDGVDNWRNIRIDNVDVRIRSEASPLSIGNLRYDMDLEYSYVRDR